MSKNHDEACYLLGEILERAFNLSALTNNYRYVEKALQYAGDQIVFDEVETYQQMSKNPAFANIFSHNQAELQDGSYRKRVGGVVTSELENVLARTAAASLVFAHSVFEDCVYGLLKIAVLVGRDDWLPFVEKKQITVADLQKFSRDEILCREIDDCFNKMERQSVLKKLDALFAVIGDGVINNHQPMPTYKYDRERISQIDEDRHRVAHRDSLDYNPPTLNGDVQYLLTTMIFLSSLLIDKYGIRNKQRPFPNV